MAVIPSKASASSLSVIPSEVEGSTRSDFSAPAAKTVELLPEFQIVFRRLPGRLSSLARFHCGAPLDVDFRGLIDQASQVRLIDNQTRWVSWTRYSNRQRQRMDWEGMIGRATYEGELEAFWLFLLFGQWTHVGKGTTFGLGKYRVWAFQ